MTTTNLAYNMADHEGGHDAILVEIKNGGNNKMDSHDCDDTYHYFSDGVRRIDFVMAYVDDHDENPENKGLFEHYLNYLREEFELHTEIGGSAKKTNKNYGAIKKKTEEPEGNDDVQYVLVHAPIEVLYRSAEDLQMKLPTQLNDLEIKDSWYKNNFLFKCLKKIDPFRLRRPETHEEPNYFVAKFDEDRLTEFLDHDEPDRFFSPAERGRLVSYLLQRAKYGPAGTDVGIENLIHSGVLLDAYPLHDGPLLQTIKEKPTNQRQRLQTDWASMRCLFKYQPIGAIREYFGEKVALYFAWLGFYTAFLVPAAVVGILCFIYGVLTSMGNPVTTESCSDPRGPNGTHLFYMCPICDKSCSYFLLEVNCLYARATAVFDNEATLFFAVFMSIWASLFLEFWKRKDISLAYEWRAIGFEDLEEQVRPEYSASAPTIKRNPITKKDEHYVPKSTRFRKLSGTVTVVFFFVILVLVFLLGVVIFRAFLNISLLATGNKLIESKSKMIVSIVAGLLNLVAINILKFFYNKVAVMLTDWENPRTRTDYEDSFTIKMFLFQFFNTYSSIIYVAFLKSEAITGSPGNYNRFGKSGLRVDGCSAQGCFLGLTIQLIIIMVGQQLISNVVEILLPTTLKWWHKRSERKKLLAIGATEVKQTQWAGDYMGSPQTKFSLFWEYLEIVLQYGFVTMFVSGFPLAPFFALFNNVLEIRVDAYNYVRNSRRPTAQRAEDIGAWYGILATLTKMSVLINAFVIAFTSDLIPKLVYQYHISTDGSMHGYVNWSLSTFNVADFSDVSRPLNPTANNITQQLHCRYPGFHQPFKPYKRDMDYWLILSARLGFILAFVCFVLFVSWLINYIIPDVPHNLALKMKREKYLALEADKQHRMKLGKKKKEQ